MRLLILAAFLLATPAIAQPGQKAITGEWQGTGLQVDRGGVQSTWTIELSIRNGQSAISYPSLDCKGVLHRVTTTPTRIAFREEITDGNCIDGGQISATFENGRLFWFWTKPGLDVDASAVLYPSGPIA
ncbi:MAG TPA: hypothetical protein PLN33_10595 [Hyphomonadaceae bacterium]|nr:hypothetical protein [Hyphomonadaceae bacterium]HPN04393.1 hypothetical protein [Hyphomonadaceae bacterium]